MGTTQDDEVKRMICEEMVKTNNLPQLKFHPTIVGVVSLSKDVDTDEYMDDLHRVFDEEYHIDKYNYTFYFEMITDKSSGNKVLCLFAKNLDDDNEYKEVTRYTVMAEAPQMIIRNYTNINSKINKCLKTIGKVCVSLLISDKNHISIKFDTIGYVPVKKVNTMMSTILAHCNLKYFVKLDKFSKKEKKTYFDIILYKEKDEEVKSLINIGRSTDLQLVLQ